MVKKASDHQHVLIMVDQPLTDIDRAEYGKEMAAMLLEIQQLEDEKKEQAARLKAKIERITSELKRHGRVVRRGTVKKEVEAYYIDDLGAMVRYWYKKGSTSKEPAIKTEQIKPEQTELPVNTIGGEVK